ncbi:MAG: hypothetical protein A4E45_00634 [Methanosaeta sp. PtaB.Bin039]|nr:MAG: hypothetical protein A4E45_00634 [Methanosaeta sp. PtaB.Bin039]OPY47108.1 MAG: hypothetical protein A4E47_00375 [Methanosaeta sp. PtaU1.Bin028]
MKARLAVLGLIALISLASSQDNYIPLVSGDNFWTMEGSPSLTATVTGTNEFDRGDTVTLYLDLINYGRFMGFKKDKTPDGALDQALAGEEQKLEQAKTTAIGIKATLNSDNDQIEVQSGDQVVEALKSGAKTANPIKFSIKIAKHAPAGRYNLTLDLRYDYQYNVEVDASSFNRETNSLVGFRTSYWYQKKNETVAIPIIVKRKADFQITDVESRLSVGQKKGQIEVIYQNIGEDPVQDGIARLSIFKPFTSTDDQAYLGELKPGEAKKVVFRVDVDTDATPKEYGINSEIKYTDVRGDTIISESMKIPVTVYPAQRSMLIPALAVLAVIALSGGYIYRRNKKKA